MAQASDLSVVIPMRNGVPEVRACIEGILDQTVRPREIIVIDSGSTDDSLRIVQEYSLVSVERIPPESFNHGETRNLGARLASGDMILMTVQDARPASSDWIAKLTEGMTDENVAGVCGAQVVPHERDKNPAEWYRPQLPPEILRFQFAPGEFQSLSPSEKRRVCAWDNVTALYRRDVLLELPFRRTDFGEDILWAHDAILAGWTLVYNSAARVFHYHNETEEFAFQRALASMYYRYVATGYVPSTTRGIREMMRVVGVLLREDRITWRERQHWLRYNWRNQLAIRRAVSVFREASARGEAEALYRSHSGSAMVPEKPAFPVPS